MQFFRSWFIHVWVLIMSLVSTMTIDAVPHKGTESERIIAGRDASLGQFPYAVALYYNNQFICTASIISPTTVLTAAHCIILDDELQPAELFHGIANVLRKADEVRIDFASAIPHPDYSFDGQGVNNDIAVLKTTEPIDFAANENVRPVCIAAPDTDPEAYGEAIAMGWGDVIPFRFNPFSYLPNNLKYTEQRIVGDAECSNINSGSSGDKICARGPIFRPYASICSGDSGGPLVHLSDDDTPPVEIGVASYTLGPLGCGLSLAVWTRISDHFDFIMQNADDSAICTI